MSKLRVEGRQGWSWSHFLISLKAVLAPVYSMTGTPKEIASWLQFDTFKPLTDSGRSRLLRILKEGGLHSGLLPLEKKTALYLGMKWHIIVGYEMALPKPLNGHRFAIVGLKQDEKDGKIDFMAASINYKSWTDFQDAVENSDHSSTAVAQCDKRMWTSGVTNFYLKDEIGCAALCKADSQARGVSPDFQENLSYSLKSELLWEDYFHLSSVVNDYLPLTTIFSIPEKLTDLCAELTTCDYDEIRGQLRRLRFVGGAQQVWINSKSIGFTYFVWDNGAPLTSFWYKKAGEKGWVREVRRKNRQSNQYEYAAQELGTIKLDEPIPQTFGGSEESLILSRMPLNEAERKKIKTWLLPPRFNNEAETESTADVSETDSF